MNLYDEVLVQKFFGKMKIFWRKKKYENGNGDLPEAISGDIIDRELSRTLPDFQITNSLSFPIK